MATTRYTQNIAIEQFPAMVNTIVGIPSGSDGFGGGPVAGPNIAGYPVQLNDAGLQIGQVRTVTAIYQLYGNESVNDIINIYLAEPGSMIDPSFSSVSAAASTASTLTISVGDDDVTGYGLVSSGVAFTGTPLPGTTWPGAITPTGASTTRYSTSLSAVGTNANTFTGGTAFADPYVIGTFATEPPGNSSNLTPGFGVAGSWIQATILTIAGQTAGKCLVFRLRVIKP